MSIETQIAQISALRDKAYSARDRALASAEKYEKEAKDFETAVAVLSKLMPEPLREKALDQQDETSVGAYQPGSIASRILKFMRESDKLWWTANELQDEMGKVGDFIKMTSISPNLSRLKDNNDIVRDDLKVALADRAPKSAEASEGDLLTGKPSEASYHDRPYQPVEPQAEGREAAPGGGT